MISSPRRKSRLPRASIETWRSPSAAASSNPISASARSTLQAKPCAGNSMTATSAFSPMGPSIRSAASGRRRRRHEWGAPLVEAPVRIADRIKGSLAAKLLLITAGVGIVIALLISAIEIWQESRTAIADQQRDTKAAVMANIDTLALAVWSVDDRVLELTASSLIRGTSIFHIEVVDDGATVLKLDRPGPAPAADYAWELPILRPNSDQQIATLKMWESYDGVRAPLKRRAGVLVITELTKILATSVLLFFVAYLLVTRPLKMLARKVT